jgi:microcystin-dependent protein
MNIPQPPIHNTEFGSQPWTAYFSQLSKYLKGATEIVKIGEIFDWPNTTAPSYALACPIAQTNISRTTYSALFTAIGTTWGVGDGSTTFGMPWFPADYGSIQANSNVATKTTGTIQSHKHTISVLISASNTGGGVGGVNNPSNTPSTVTGDNVAAGVRMLKCVRIV